jgi:delta24-sterol reductase
VFDKVKVDVEKQSMTQQLPWFRRLGTLWPFVNFLGIRSAIRSKDYLIHRELGWMRSKIETSH